MERQKERLLAYVLLKLNLELSHASAIYLIVSLLALRSWLVFASCFRLFWGPNEDDCMEFESVRKHGGMYLNVCGGVCMCVWYRTVGSSGTITIKCKDLLVLQLEIPGMEECLNIASSIEVLNIVITSHACYKD